MRVVRTLYRFLLALSRELSDETPYRRYLANTGREHSPAEWRLFSERRHRRKYQNAKCC